MVGRKEDALTVHGVRASIGEWQLFCVISPKLVA